MKKIFALELRRQVPPYLLCALGLVGLGLYRVVSQSSDISLFLLGIFVMLSTSGLVVWSVYRLCSYWLYGRDQLLHLPPLKAPQVLFVKCAASSLLLFGYFVGYTAALATGADVVDLGAAAADKALSLVTFFAFVCGLLALVKWAFRPAVAVVVGISLYWSVTIATGVLWWGMVARTGESWGLGVDTEYRGFVSYLNAIPVLVFSNGNSTAVGQPQVVAAVLNVAVALVVGGLGLIMARTVRYNFAEVAA